MELKTKNTFLRPNIIYRIASRSFNNSCFTWTRKDLYRKTIGPIHFSSIQPVHVIWCPFMFINREFPEFQK